MDETIALYSVDYNGMAPNKQWASGLQAGGGCGRRAAVRAGRSRGGVLRIGARGLVWMRPFRNGLHYFLRLYNSFPQAGSIEFGGGRSFARKNNPARGLRIEAFDCLTGTKNCDAPKAYP